MKLGGRQGPENTGSGVYNSMFVLIINARGFKQLRGMV